MPPFKLRQDRQVISRAPKFYLFDVGVAGEITGRHLEAEKGEVFGRALEHFVLTELAAHASYSELGYAIEFWRTKSGLEVDFVLGKGEVAVEVKGATLVDNRELRSLQTFADEYRPRQAYLVCCEREERVVGNIRLMPWRHFLAALWGGEVIQ